MLINVNAMKKIHILEKKLNEIWHAKEFCAGTDTPYFEDEKTGEVYDASWNSDYGFPFGYWPIDYSGEMQFVIGDAWTTHANACGKCAQDYFNDMMYEQIDDEAYQLSDAMERFASNFKEYGYQYNEESDMWVSEDGSDERDMDGFIEEIRDEVSGPIDIYEYVYNFVEDYINGYDKVPSSSEIYEYLNNQISEEYDFTEQRGIDDAMKELGMDFYQYFEMGQYEGRIWPQLEMIGFYTTEQPEPRALEEILRNLSQGLNISLDELYNYHMVFEDADNDYQITACTLSQYMRGEYGPEYDSEDEEEYEEPQERHYGRDEKTVFVPHLANQQQKREYFKDFRDTRDKAVYAPRERGAGNLAAYHAMRYPYGENKEKHIALTESDLHALVKEAVKNILEGGAWSKYPDEDITQAELDANMNDKTNGDFANAYVRKDPMVNNIHGSTLRDMLKASMGNGIR